MTQMQNCTIPIIKLGQLGLENKGEPSDNEWKRVATELKTAFENIGFVYLSGHGIPDQQVDWLFKAGEAFFSLPQDRKDSYQRREESYHGYVAINSEKLDRSYENEVRESFNIRNADECFPDDEVPEFRVSSRDFLISCNNLAYRIFTAMSLGLGLPRDFFSDAHRLLSKNGNSSVARVLFYPPVPADKLLNSTRCGEHSDYGTLTLLFQDDIGGLQVYTREKWIDADSIPGTILVNIGDLLQLWTSGKFKATKHRVVIPKDEERQRLCRRSLVYFIHPDDSKLIKPLDDSKEFEPITSKDYLDKRLTETCKLSSS
ncbi:uncharacterized protein [Palaemon carinicauda]|uniref:uncharacterized protein n=1 Tax=Palaemon carinicauda TaxID=392227 RepID=UPI0035B5B182